jgi:hypothetical protein
LRKRLDAQGFFRDLGVMSLSAALPILSHAPVSGSASQAWRWWQDIPPAAAALHRW